MIKGPIFQKYITVLNLNVTNNRTSNIHKAKIDSFTGETAKFTVSLGNFNTPLLVAVSKD